MSTKSKLPELPELAVIADDLRAHLTAPLKDGGHGLSDASYTVVWMDNEQFHNDDHSSFGWFSEALLHTHRCDRIEAQA